MNVIELFAEQVRIRPKAPAIIESCRGGDRLSSFSELEQRSARVAHLFRSAGVQAGDPVLIFHPISSDLYAVLLALFRLGAVAMFVEVSANPGLLDECCKLLPPRAFVGSPKAHLLRMRSAGVRRIPLKFITGRWLPGAIPIKKTLNGPVISGWESCASDTAALLTFTSGSTGAPKAVLRTHGLLLAQGRSIERHLTLQPGEVDLATLPIFALANLASGVTSVIPDADLRSPGAIDPAPVLAQIDRHMVTRATASPALFECLLNKGAHPALGQLKKIYTGGAPVFPRLLDRLSHAAPHARVEAVYGSTEAEPIAHVEIHDMTTADRDAMRKGNGLLAGTPIPEIRLAILPNRWGQPISRMSKEEFAAQKIPPEQIGEIVVTGDHVLKSYLHGRGDEETKISVGDQVWHRTGDAGKSDHLGRLWLQGRCEARIQDQRGELYPFAVECVASEHQNLRRAACVAVNGKRLLAIEPVNSLQDAEYQNIRDDLKWASIDQVHTLKHIPVDRRHNAKVDYPALRRAIAAI